MTGHTVVIGYGTKGRAAIATLLRSRVDTARLAIIDRREEEVAAATADGLTAVLGDGSRQAVLNQARADTAQAVIIAIPHDESALLARSTRGR